MGHIWTYDKSIEAGVWIEKGHFDESAIDDMGDVGNG
jgi:hypothetical protein